MALPAWLALVFSAAGGATAAHVVTKLSEKPKPKEGTLRPEIKLNVPVSVLTGPDIQITGELLRAPQLNLKAKILKDPYKGWLGALLLHGSVVQASYFAYLKKHKFVGPDKKHKPSSSYTEKEEYPNTREHFLYTFTEFPPPLPKIPTWLSDFEFSCTALDRTNLDTLTKVALWDEHMSRYYYPKVDTHGVGDLWFRVPGGKYNKKRFIDKKHKIYCEIKSKDKKWYSIYAQTKQIANILVKAPQYVGFNFNRFPKKPKWPKDYDRIIVPFIDSDPIDWFDDRVRHMYWPEVWSKSKGMAIDRDPEVKAYPFPGIDLAKSDTVIVGHKTAYDSEGKAWEVHDYEKIDNIKHLREYIVYAQRLRNYYCTARWLVWAAEMWRIHSDYNDYIPPPAWRDYCLMWGIGCAEKWRRNARPTLKSFKDAPVPNPDKKVGKKSAIPTEILLTRMMQLIPVPGGIPNGTEIGRGRLADWPITSGNFAPPYNFGIDYVESIIQHYDMERIKKEQIESSILMAITQFAISVVASYLAPVLNAAVSAAYSLTNIAVILQTVSNIVQFARKTASLFTHQFDTDIFGDLSKLSFNLDAKGVFSKLENYAVELETLGNQNWGSKGFSVDLLGGLSELPEVKEYAKKLGKTVFDKALAEGVSITNPDIEAPKMVVRLTELRPEIKLVGEVTALGKSQWS